MTLLLAVVSLIAQEWTVPARPPMRRDSPIAAALPVTLAPSPVVPSVGPLLAAERATGVVSVTVSPVPKQATERILSKRAARHAMPWVVTLRNDSQEPVSVAESAVLARIPQLQPFDYESMSLLVAEAETNSAWQRAGRAAEDVGKLGALFLATSNNFRIGNGWLIGITAAMAVPPYVVQRLRGADRPVRQSFDRLAWVVPVTLEPGESASRRVFTAAQANPRPASFTLEIGTVRAVKAVR